MTLEYLGSDSGVLYAVNYSFYHIYKVLSEKPEDSSAEIKDF